MTLEELDELEHDTRRVPRVEDRVAFNMTLAVIEIARQLMLLNQKLGGAASPAQPATKQAAKKR